MTSSAAVQPTELGGLLRHWRGLRGKSQLDLSLDLGASQRHLSFIESGRSRPSRRKLIDIADALDIPLRERNILLLAAGYAPIYADAAWDEPEMQPVTAALQRMLRQQEPFPAVVMDRYWNVVMTNEAAPRFFGAFVDLEARPKPRNLLHLMFDPAGMRPHLAGWPATARSLLARVRREAVGRVVDDRTRALLDELLAYPDVEPVAAPIAAAASPIVPLRFVRDGETLDYFSIISTVGAPQTIATQELRLECMFPVDQVTEQRHLALMERLDHHTPH